MYGKENSIRFCVLAILLLFGSDSFSQGKNFIQLTHPSIIKQYQTRNFETYSLNEISALFKIDSNWVITSEFIGKSVDKQHMYGKLVEYRFWYTYFNPNFGFKIFLRKSFETKQEGKRFHREQFYIHDFNIQQPELENVHFIVSNSEYTDTIAIGETLLEDIHLTEGKEPLKINATTFMVGYNGVNRLYFVQSDKGYILDQISMSL